MENRSRDALLAGGTAGGLLAVAIGTLLATKPAEGAPGSEQLDYLIRIYELLVAQMDAIVQATDKLATAASIISEPTGVQTVLPLSFDIEAFNTLLQASRFEGDTTISNWRLSWTCPAGVTTQVPLNLPSGMVCTRRKGLIISDFYDEDVVMQVLVDRKPVADFGLPLTGPLDFDFAEGFVKREVVQVDCVNGTLFDAQVTLDLVCNLMEKEIYDGIYEPYFALISAKVREIGVSYAGTHL